MNMQWGKWLVALLRDTLKRPEIRFLIWSCWGDSSHVRPVYKNNSSSRGAAGAEVKKKKISYKHNNNESSCLPLYISSFHSCQLGGGNSEYPAMRFTHNMRANKSPVTTSHLSVFDHCQIGSHPWYLTRRCSQQCRCSVSRTRCRISCEHYWGSLLKFPVMSEWISEKDLLTACQEVMNPVLIV